MEKDITGLGLFGGSFDPVHNGHLAIAKSFLNSPYISKLLILPTPHPPHKLNTPLTDYELRLNMLKAAFEGWKNVAVSNIENQLPRPSYTVRTLRYFYKKNIAKPLYLCLGEDSVRDFEEWKNWKEILCYCNLIAARRPDAELQFKNDILAGQTHFVDHDAVDISSTEIRAFVRRQKSISSLVPQAVENIIREHNLYSN